MKFKQFICLGLAILVATMLAACGATYSSDSGGYPGNTALGVSKETDQAYMTTAAATTMAPPMGDSMAEYQSGQNAGEISGQPAADTGRKLIRTGRYSLETMEYNQTIQQIEELVNRVGGYIQDSNSQGEGAISTGYNPRRSSYTVRIPVERFSEVGTALQSIATVVSSSQNAEEVTDYYYDTEARLKTLRVQEERLLALMSQATELEAIITLESTLSGVRYQIESNEGTLRRLDSQIAFSTISIDIREVFEPTKIEPVPVTLGQRISARFRNTLQDIKGGFEAFLVVLLGDGLRVIMAVAILGAVALVVWRIVKAVKKRRPPQPPQGEE